MTFIAALRHDRISAPWVIDGPINGELFTLYVEKVFAHTLAPGAIVVLDSLGSPQRKSGWANYPRQRRPPHLPALYSPDLNPIEQVFAKLKHLMRAAAPRSVEATWRKVGELLNLFSGEECTNYLKNSGAFPCKDSMLLTVAPDVWCIDESTSNDRALYDGARERVASHVHLLDFSYREHSAVFNASSLALCPIILSTVRCAPTETDGRGRKHIATHTRNRLNLTLRQAVGLRSQSSFHQPNIL
ncbi:transposase [Bradyrhizobium elkanii]|nr:transposase [Bradyrhizobium elkanii]